MPPNDLLDLPTRQSVNAADRNIQCKSLHSSGPGTQTQKIRSAQTDKEEHTLQRRPRLHAKTGELVPVRKGKYDVHGLHRRIPFLKPFRSEVVACVQGAHHHSSKLEGDLDCIILSLCCWFCKRVVHPPLFTLSAAHKVASLSVWQFCKYVALFDMSAEQQVTLRKPTQAHAGLHRNTCTHSDNFPSHTSHSLILPSLIASTVCFLTPRCHD